MDSSGRLVFIIKFILIITILTDIKYSTIHIIWAFTIHHSITNSVDLKLTLLSLHSIILIHTNNYSSDDKNV